MTPPRIGDRRPREGRCASCDRPLGDEEWIASPPQWHPAFLPGEGRCRGDFFCSAPIDWRARALAAEGALRDSLVYAARYAMGRSTCAVDDMIRIVRSHSTPEDRAVLIADLRSAFDAIERGETRRLGPYAAEWRALLDWMIAKETP